MPDLSFIEDELLVYLDEAGAPASHSVGLNDFAGRKGIDLASAMALAAAGRSTFVFVLAAPPLVGAVDSPVVPVAVL